MNAQTQTAAADFLASRAFFQSPAMATKHEAEVGDLIRANARAGKHFKAVPVNTTGKKLTPHMQQFLDHVKTNPGQSAEQIAAALDISVKSVAMRFFYMRQDGHLPQTEGPMYLQHRPAAERLRASGSTQAEIARVLGISTTTAARALGARR